MLLARGIVGLLGVALLAGVIGELATGSFSYALTERFGRGVTDRVTGHETVRSTEGLLFAFGSFGVMGLSAVAFALRPRLFRSEALVWFLVAVVVSAFVGLRLSR